MSSRIEEIMRQHEEKMRTQFSLRNYYSKMFADDADAVLAYIVEKHGLDIDSVQINEISDSISKDIIHYGSELSAKRSAEMLRQQFMQQTDVVISNLFGGTN